MLAYVEQVANEPETVDAASFDRLREHLGEEEIVELAIFLTLNLGMHVFFATLDIYPMFAPDGRLIDQEESIAIYGDNPVSLQGQAAE